MAMNKVWKFMIFFLLPIFGLTKANTQLFKFISSIDVYFPYCDIVIVHNDPKDQFQDINSQMLAHLSQIPNPSTHFFGHLFFPNLEYNSYEGVHRHAEGHCSFVILIIFDLNNSTLISNQIFYLLTKNLGAISRKDSDKYLFLTQEDLTHQILSLDISKRIKYKLALGFSNDLDLTRSESVCFYCENGNARIVNIPLFNGEVFPDFVQNFYGHQLRISSPTRVTSAVEVEEIGSKNWRAKRGHQIEMLREIQRILNFTYKVAPGSGGGGTGTLFKNGTWNGGVGDLVSGKADLSMITGQIYERNKVIGFNFPFIHMRLTFIVGRPQATFSWQSIWWAFNYQVWISFLCTFFVFLGILVSIQIFHAKSNLNLTKNALFIIGVLLEQSPLIISRSNTLRVLTIFWLYFSVILTTAYRSKLLIFLAFPDAEKPPETFPDLADSDFTWGLEGAGVGGAAYDTFKSANNPTYQKLTKKMKFEPDPIKCLLRGFKQKFACIAYREQLRFTFYKNFSSRSRQNHFVVSMDSTFYCPTGYAIAKRSIIGPSFDRIILAMLDSGVVDFWRERDYESVRIERLKWQQEQGLPPLIPDEVDGPKTLTMSNFRGAFNLLIVGALGSLLFFTYELYKLVQLNRLKRNIPRIELTLVPSSIDF